MLERPRLRRSDNMTTRNKERGPAAGGRSPLYNSNNHNYVVSVLECFVSVFECSVRVLECFVSFLECL